MPIPATLTASELIDLLKEVPPTARVWIDTLEYGLLPVSPFLEPNGDRIWYDSAYHKIPPEDVVIRSEG